MSYGLPSFGDVLVKNTVYNNKETERDNIENSREDSADLGENKIIDKMQELCNFLLQKNKDCNFVIFYLKVIKWTNHLRVCFIESQGCGFHFHPLPSDCRQVAGNVSRPRDVEIVRNFLKTKFSTILSNNIIIPLFSLLSSIQRICSNLRSQKLW